MKSILLIILLCNFAVCQVNTEAMRNSKERSGFLNTLGFDFGFEKSKEEVLEVSLV